METNNFFEIKLTFERIAISILFIFCISISVFLIKQNNEIQRFKSELNQQETFIKNVDSNVDDLENKISDFKNKISDLESKVDELESNQNY